MFEELFVTFDIDTDRKDTCAYDMEPHMNETFPPILIINCFSQLLFTCVNTKQ